MRSAFKSIAFILILIGSSPLTSRAGTTCALKVSLAERDTLGNVDVGIDPQDQKWFAKMLKRYPAVCYAEQKPNEGIWLYLSVSNSSRDTDEARTRTLPDGNGGTTSQTVITNESASVYTLKIGRFKDNKLEVLRTFQRAKTSGGAGTVTGLFASFGNPERDVIEDAIDWLSKSGLVPSETHETSH